MGVWLALIIHLNVVPDVLLVVVIDVIDVVHDISKLATHIFDLGNIVNDGFVVIVLRVLDNFIKHVHFLLGGRLLDVIRVVHTYNVVVNR